MTSPTRPFPLTPTPPESARTVSWRSHRHAASRMAQAALFPLIALILSAVALPAHGQVAEPDLLVDDKAASAYGEGLRNAASVVLSANNFGFSLRGQYDRAITPMADLVLQAGVSGLRDVSEQTYTDYFFGQQVIPNKFQRGMSFPVLAGIRHRLFARNVQDSYRFYVSGSAGGVFAFTYPYFDDLNGNGYRERFFEYYENTFDMLTGWKDGTWHAGLAGEFTIGIDFGRDFEKVSRLQFGYLFYYFPDSVQMMMPNQPVPDPNAGPNDFPYLLNPDLTLKMQPFFDSQSFFGTPVLSFSFGGMW